MTGNTKNECNHLVDAQQVHPHVQQRLLFYRRFHMTDKLGRAVTPRVADKDGDLRRKEVRHFVTCITESVGWEHKLARDSEELQKNRQARIKTLAPATVS